MADGGEEADNETLERGSNQSPVYGVSGGECVPRKSTRGSNLCLVVASIPIAVATHTHR